MPRVSVIMPVHNGERFIAEAIDSVLAQTLQDWELIVVDDGSTDGTPQILAEFGDPRVTVIHQENRGAAAARNAALDLATGEYIGLLDADDLYLPNALEDMVDFLSARQDFDVVYSDGIMCDSGKRPIMNLTEIRPAIHEGWVLEEVVLSPSIITVPVCTLSRHVPIVKHRIRFDAALAPSEDYDFWIQLAQHCRFGYLDKLTCKYRIHNANITKTTGSQRRRQALVQGRMKILNSAWFPELSTDTQRAFFYNLLVELLGDDPQRQEEITGTAAFRRLSAVAQAKLLRLMAGSHFSRRQNTEFAMRCLQRSLALQPYDRKSRSLLRLAGQSPLLAAVALSAWRVAHNAQVTVQTLGKRRPKPVPAALLRAVERG